MQLLAGGMLQWLESFTPLFVICGLLHPITWITIRLLTGKTIQQVDLDQGLRTAKSPGLLVAGAALLLVGTAGASLFWSNWDRIVADTGNSPATAAGGVAASAMVALMGLALAYASQAQRPATA